MTTMRPPQHGQDRGRACRFDIHTSRFDRCVAQRCSASRFSRSNEYLLYTAPISTTTRTPRNAGVYPQSRSRRQPFVYVSLPLAY
jgi:hypothetical protein